MSKFLSEVKTNYESPSDNLGKDFLAPALKECVRYRRETAWFKASAVRAWAGALKYIVNKDVKIEILAFPKIDETTFQSLKSVQSENDKDKINKRNFDHLIQWHLKQKCNHYNLGN